jgi:hypothetical protein
METPYWLHKPRILLDDYLDIIPTKDHRGYKLFNALTRLLLYSLILLIALKQDYKLTLILLLLVNIIGMTHKTQVKKQVCRKATYDNPMGNVLLMTDDTNMEACDEDYERYVLQGVNEDSRKLFRNKNVIRTFIRMPVTRYPANSTDLAKQLYNPGEGCKTTNKNCKTYSDVRYYR